LSTKAGKEPKLAALLNEDGQCAKLFLISDGQQVCDADTVMDGLLLLFGLYYMLNLNYPKHYAQLLGFVQVTCLKEDFPVSQRNTQFVKLKESLLL